MKTTLILYALALVAPIAAAPKQPYQDGASSVEEAGASSYSQTNLSPTGAPNAGQTQRPKGKPWGRKSHKNEYKDKHHHHSGDNSGAPFPTLHPGGDGCEDSSSGVAGATGMGGGTGVLSQPTYVVSSAQSGETGGYSGGNNGGNNGGNGGNQQSTAGGGSPTGGLTGGTETAAGNGPTSVPSTSPSTGNGTTSGNGTVVSSGGVTLPAGCQVKNGIGIGWLPGTSEKIGDIESALGVTACFDGEYAQITETGAYTDSSNQLLSSLTQIVGGKTIFIASLMPSIALSTVDATVAGGVANVMKQFTDKGIEVWLRFAHEMNWYVRDGTYKGTSADFQKAWAAISSAVESNSQVKMFWSPNQASASEIQSGGWYPTSGKVDIVGIDIYPKSQQTFGEVYGDFCKTFSNDKNIPFAIGETGAGPDIKQYWLGQLAAGDKSACTNYVGFSWFDYNKEADFQVVEGGSTIAKQVLG